MKKILLADDSITIQKVVELTFSEDDYQVSCVSNGMQALKRITEWRPDVVLLDVIMPERNGYEVCEEIKRNPATAGIPALLLSGTFEPFDQQRADAAGARGHLTKPFESQALVSKVEELLAGAPDVPAGAPTSVGTMPEGRMNQVETPDAGTDTPTSAAFVSAQGDALQPGAAPPSIADPTPLDSLDGDALMGEDPSTPRDHPALQTPDPAAGGSYVGFADLDADGADSPEIIPDRFDELPSVESTLRPDRADLPGAAGAPPSSDPQGGFGLDEPVRHVVEAPIEGLTGAFEIQDPTPEVTGLDASFDEPGSPEGFAPPPPPAPVSTAPPSDRHASPGPAAAQGTEPAGGGAGTAAGGNGPVTLTPEAIDLIAERVVQRISDRVVREIAWDVVPHMAEAIVRQRIKELEDSEGS